MLFKWDHEILLERLPLSSRVTLMANVQGPVLLLHCKRANSETGHGLILHTRPEIPNLVSLAHDQVHEKVHYGSLATHTTLRAVKFYRCTNFWVYIEFNDSSKKKKKTANFPAMTLCAVTRGGSFYLGRLYLHLN